MIAKLRGVVDTIGDDYCILDVNGVGYLVYASSKTLSRLIIGNQFSLLIETVVREDSISLFGFYDAWEKEWFLTLTKVQGVGAKVCLSILSVLSPAELSQAVSAQDKTLFLRANGVGPKLAARLITELKDKIVTIPTEYLATKDLNTVINEDQKQTPTTYSQKQETSDETDETYKKTEDVTSALSNLGYQKIDAYRVASEICLKNPDKDLATLIRLALKEFNQ
jgi:Holliday junction DNA helicase RuvA